MEIDFVCVKLIPIPSPTTQNKIRAIQATNRTHPIVIPTMGNTPNAPLSDPFSLNSSDKTKAKKSDQESETTRNPDSGNDRVASINPDSGTEGLASGK
jgi:hypothetical protein